ncbi:hypothetical protein BU25DRAFT_466733, partial [Macroventuria anomochaeta]
GQIRCARSLTRHSFSHILSSLLTASLYSALANPHCELTATLFSKHFLHRTPLRFSNNRCSTSNPLFQHIQILQLRLFRRHHTQHNRLSLGQEPRRVKLSSLICLILQKKSVVLQFEESLRNLLVTPLCEPQIVRQITAAEMNPRRQPFEMASYRVVVGAQVCA